MYCKDWCAIEQIEALVLATSELTAHSLHVLHPGSPSTPVASSWRCFDPSAMSERRQVTPGCTNTHLMCHWRRPFRQPWKHQNRKLSRSRTTPNPPAVKPRRSALFEITIALMTTAALGLSFHTTRWWGLAAATALHGCTHWPSPLSSSPPSCFTSSNVSTPVNQGELHDLISRQHRYRHPTCPGLG
jgi:hypothetical protein